jgi:hypothetical protein
VRCRQYELLDPLKNVFLNRNLVVSAEQDVDRVGGRDGLPVVQGTH